MTSRATSITIPGAGRVTAPARGFILRAGQVVAAPVAPTPTHAEAKRFTLFGAVNSDVDVANPNATPRPALTGPSFRFGSWTWWPEHQTAVSTHYGRVLITSPLLVQALAYLVRLSGTFTKSDATKAASYLDACKVEIPTPDAATWSFHAALTDWLGSKLEANGRIPAKDAAAKSGTDPSKWHDKSDLGSNKGFLDTLSDEAHAAVQPLASALGVSAGVALAGLALLAFLALKK